MNHLAMSCRAAVFAGAARRGLPFLLLAALLTAGCDNTFQPVGDTGPSFSIFGYLNASADTQFIRINTLRSTLTASKAPLGVSVQLEEMASGQVIELSDSAMRYGNAIGSDSLYAHNFWTTERIEPGASYRLRAVSPDGDVAEGVVKIPRDYQLEVWTRQQTTGAGSAVPGPEGQSIRIAGLRHVPFVISYTSFYNDCAPLTIKRHVQTGANGGDSVERFIGTPQPAVEGPPECGSPRITRLVVQVVGSEGAWPFGEDHSTSRLAPDYTSSNVSNSLGFVGGVLTKSIPVELCEFAYPSSTEAYCKLRYDANAASLLVTVLGAGCPVPTASTYVELRELESSSPEPPRVRRGYGAVDPSGSLEIGALRPGLRHLLTIRAGSGFVTYTDTLTFTAGQQSTHHATLQPSGPCVP